VKILVSPIGGRRLPFWVILINKCAFQQNKTKRKRRDLLGLWALLWCGPRLPRLLLCCTDTLALIM
jgi:hypothetical protein